MRLCVVDDDVFLEDRAPLGHPEREARLLAARRGLDSAHAASEGALSSFVLPPRDVSFEELRRVHDLSLVERIAATAGKQGVLDGDTYFTPGSYRAALRAAGGVIAAVEALDPPGGRAEDDLVDSKPEGGFDYGIALVRPPGHHATRDTAMGFCLFNNVAIGAAHALARGAERVMIVDWDVHHGNGTEDIFYERADVLYLSLHQSPQYPGTGRASDLGRGAGLGYNVNLPLSSGADDRVYRSAFTRVVQPVVRSYAPDVLIVSAGYDVHARDPLGGMRLSDAAFAMMTRALCDALPDAGRRRLLFVLEGGYDEAGVEGGVRETALALARPGDEAAAPEPPTSGALADVPGPGAPADVPAPWRGELDRAHALVSRHWDLSPG